MDETPITEADEGKDVVNADGDTIGIVSSVRNGTAYVDPDPGIGDRILTKLGWSRTSDQDYPLDDAKIETVTDDEIRLVRDV